MAEQHDPFFPHHVDEAIEQISSHLQANRAIRGQQSIDPSVQLIHDLQKKYDPERGKNQQALQRVENRLLEHYAAQDKRVAGLPAAPFLQREQQLNQWTMPQRRRVIDIQEKRVPISRMASFGRSVGLLAVVCMLIGSIVLVLSYVHQRGTTPGGSGVPIVATPIKRGGKPTPTALPSEQLGKTLYTTPSSNLGFSGLSWSPDSKRVAFLEESDNIVQIWDATDGKHLVNVEMPYAGEYPYGVEWSPNSQLVAVTTNQQVLLVNGESGKVVKRYGGNNTAITQPISPQVSYLSSQFPNSGGYGYRAAAWSPDGKQIAVALSSIGSGIVQVWNSQTGAMDFTLTVNPPYNVGALSWSSDGQYIAASMWDTQASPTNLTQPTNMIVVWQASTQQMIFQHKDSLVSSYGIVRWQPQSHNLAFEGTNFSNSKLQEMLEIWNGVTGNLVKQYVGVGTGSVDWSPDGRYLAYSGFGSNIEVVVIRDMVTDKEIYSYTGHQEHHINGIAWSPNGKYIVSSEGNIQGNLVAKVWVAE